MTSPRVLIVFLALLHIYVCNAIQQSGLSATLKTSIEAEDYDRPQRSGLIFGRRRRSTKSLTAGGVASFAAVSTCSVSGCGSAGSRVYQQQSSSIASTLLLRGGTLRSRIIRSGNKNAAGGNNKKDDKNSISLDEDEDDDDDDDDDDIFGTSSKAGEQKETYELMISTMYGSAFLDKKKKITCRWNDTIRDVKEQLSKKFAGSPAVALQHLYMGNRELRDDEIVANISTAALPMIPVQLDMMSGTSVYGKTMSIRQALEAYVATIVQHSYLSTELQTAYGTEPSVVDVSSSSNSSCSSSSSDKNRIIRTPYYQQLFYAVNRSIYEQYAEDIALALEEEREPEVISAETAAWRNQTAATRVSPLAAAIAKEFDLNWRGLRSFFYYSGVLAVSLSAND